jgi:DNA-binding transcriptional ArsR family regulator
VGQWAICRLGATTVLRIHFTPEDIGKVRLAMNPDPLWETVFSLFRFRYPGPPLIFGQWRNFANRACRRADLEMLMSLTPGGYYPDFLTPADSSLGLDAGLDALLGTPRSRLRRDIGLLARQRSSMPSWMGRLADGDRQILDRLAASIRSHHDAVVAPIWQEVRAHVDADRSKRARALLEGGCEGLLRSFMPMMRWQPPVLEIDNVNFERTLHLNGRGLLLVPSFLSWNNPDVLFDITLPPVLVFPMEHDLTLSVRNRTPNASVAALIGFTRAAILESVGNGRTTSELARQVGVSAPSISQHTAVLREASLIHTNRVGKAVLHTITPLGVSLLDSGTSARV